MPKTKKIDIFPGHGKKLEISLPWEIEKFKRKFFCGDKEVYHQMANGRFVAFIGMNYGQKKAPQCWLQVKRRGRAHRLNLFRLNLKEYQFEQEILNVPKKHIDLSPKNLARWQREMATQKKIYSSGVRGPYFTEEFRLPLKSTLTSSYGRKRIFNNKRNSWHSGVDFRAPIGTPIPVANDGKVVFAGDLFFNGKTVIIDHGMNIFTMYCHLSKVVAHQGKAVSKGDIIGKGGATGRVTGPHLHWGVKVAGQWINGAAFVKEGI